MILAVCLNPAIDVTFTVDRLRPGTSHRVRESRQRAGGKGINVARVLQQLDQPVVLTGLVGGRRGTAVSAELGSAGVTPHLVEVGDETRRTVTIVDPDGATVVNEAGPQVTPAEWRRFVAAFGPLVSRVEVVVLAGSLPPGVPADAYAQLTTTAHDHGVAVLLDADGDALRHGLAARPDLAKPNEHEAAPYATAAGPLDGLLAAGAMGAVVSRGADGLHAALGGRRYRAGLAHGVDGNPTGAGDALAAVLACGLRAARAAADPDWAATLRRAVAVAAAAVAVPHAGAFDPELAQRLLPLVDVQADFQEV